MSPDHIVGPNEMIGPRPTAGDHFGGFTEMVMLTPGKDAPPYRLNSLKKDLPA